MRLAALARCLQVRGDAMTLDEQFPDAEMGCEKQGGYVKLLVEPKPCFMCGTLTQWVDLGYEAPLCSVECDRQAAEDAAKLSEGCVEES